jgi:hypothetical protein
MSGEAAKRPRMARPSHEPEQPQDPPRSDDRRPERRRSMTIATSSGCLPILRGADPGFRQCAGRALRGRRSRRLSHPGSARALRPKRRQRVAVPSTRSGAAPPAKRRRVGPVPLAGAMLCGRSLRFDLTSPKPMIGTAGYVLTFDVSGVDGAAGWDTFVAARARGPTGGRREGRPAGDVRPRRDARLPGARALGACRRSRCLVGGEHA